MDLHLVWMIHTNHSSEIRSFCLMKLSNEMLQYILKKKENFKNLVAHYKLHVVIEQRYRFTDANVLLTPLFQKEKGGLKKQQKLWYTSILLNCYEKREKNCSKMKTQRGPYKIILCISLQHLLVVNGSKLVIVVKFVWTF